MKGPPDPGSSSPSASPAGATLSPEDREILVRMALWLAARRLSVPAVLFLESVKPLHFVGSQMLFFFEPMIRAVVSGKEYGRFAAMMEDRESLETFLQLIESAEAEAGRSKERGQ